MKKKCCIATVAVAALLLLGQFYYLKSGDFRVAYLLPAQKSSGRFLEGLNVRDLRRILGQNYYFLGHGNQTYAFLSEEGRYVLKLFKKEYLHRNGWSYLLPPIPPFRSFFLHRGKSKEKRREKLLNGYKTAFLHDRKNSGLIHYHPIAEEVSGLWTILVTGLGNKVSIDLNEFVFALQVKAVTTREELLMLLSLGKISEAKQRLQQLLNLYFEGYRKGIVDNDHNLIANTGFYGEQAIRQDVGKLIRDPNLTLDFFKADLEKIRDERLASWLQKYFPQHCEGLMESVDEGIQEGLQKFCSESFFHVLRD